MPWDLEREIVSAGYRHLAKKAHPDHNGTTLEMVRLNEARTRLNLVCSHGLDILFPAGEKATVPAPAPPATTFHVKPPQDTRRRVQAEPSNEAAYFWQQMQEDPLGTIFGVVNSFMKGPRKKTKPRKGAASRRAR